MTISESESEIWEKSVLLVNNGIKCNLFFLFPNNFALFGAEFSTFAGLHAFVRSDVQNPKGQKKFLFKKKCCGKIMI